MKKFAGLIQSLKGDFKQRLDLIKKKQDVLEAYRELVSLKRDIDKLSGNIAKTLSIIFEDVDSLEDKLFSRWIKENSKKEILLKEEIRCFGDRAVKKALNNKLRSMKEKRINMAIESDAVDWSSGIKGNSFLFKGIDERIIEIPLAVKFCEFQKPWLIFDAGASLNHPYIHKIISLGESRIVHFTQSSEKEHINCYKDKFSYMFGDIRNIPFKEEIFERVTCISTIEHVGMDNSRYGAEQERCPDTALLAIGEMLRILKKKGKLLLTFPYGERADLGWYRIFGREDVEKIKEFTCRLKLSAIEERFFFCRDGHWVNGTINSIDSASLGLCCLLFVK